MKNTNHIKHRIPKMPDKEQLYGPNRWLLKEKTQEEFKKIFEEDPITMNTQQDLLTEEEKRNIGTVYEPTSINNYDLFETTDITTEAPIFTTGHKYPPTSTGSPFLEGSGKESAKYKEEPWIQTYSGRRFHPLNPTPGSIVIQDIAHALSMMCRFNGHTSSFYSIAQHSVLVSYICDEEEQLWGLMHDSSESYICDFSSPLKHSGQFENYKEMEANIQRAICKRFGLPEKEPPSVKRADKLLLSTEARDLMSPLHSDWVNAVEPLPFKIEAWDQQKAKDMFMKRFFELTGTPQHYDHYKLGELGNI